MSLCFSEMKRLRHRTHPGQGSGARVGPVQGFLAEPPFAPLWHLVGTAVELVCSVRLAS